MRFAGVAFTVLLLPLFGAFPSEVARAAGPQATPAARSVAFTLRERRRLRALLRLRLLELRLAGLERVKAVLEQRLPIDALFERAPGPAAPLREH